MAKGRLMANGGQWGREHVATSKRDPHHPPAGLFPADSRSFRAMRGLVKGGWHLGCHERSIWGFQVAPVVKNLSTNAGDVRDMGWIPESGRSPGGGHSNPFLYSCLENPHGQRSLVGYSPWGRTELDTIERLSTAEHYIMSFSWWQVKNLTY